MRFTTPLRLAVLLMAFGSLAVQAQSNCAYPTKPANPPDGAKATMEEMLAASKATKQFDADVKAYQTCLDAEKDAMIKSLGADAKPEEIKRINDIQNRKIDMAAEDAATVVDAFNVQLRAFKAK